MVEADLQVGLWRIVLAVAIEDLTRRYDDLNKRSLELRRHL
jgi:hypothetical protein